MFKKSLFSPSFYISSSSFYRFYCSSSSSSLSSLHSKTLNSLKYLNVNDKNNSWWVTLNRPNVHNAFNEDVIKELAKTFRIIGHNNDNNKRAIILTGEGKSFSAGADLSWMKKMALYSFNENKEDAEYLFDMFDAIKSNPLPVIGRINGAALGGGSGLVSACDFSLCVSKAKFGFTEVKLGLIPAVISPFVIEKIGNGNASRYFTTGEMFNGIEAQRIGLVQHVYETIEEVDENINKIVEQMSLAGPNAIKSAKLLIKQINKLKGNNLEIRDYTASQIATARASKEGKEGVQSFLDKRAPKWE